jgi:hypothetical protein
MKRFQILLFLFLFLTVSRSGFGQASECCSFRNAVYPDPALPGQLFRPLAPIDNSTWYNIDWLPADITLANGEIALNKEIKYSGLLDELLWREPESNNTVMLDKAAISRFHFIDYKGDTSVYFRRLRVKRDLAADSTDVFGQEIYLGKLSLYILHTYNIERREVSAINGVYTESDIYAEVPVYYFQLQNTKTIVMKKLTRKNLYALAPEKKDQINVFFRKNNPGDQFNKSWLLSLTQFLNSIIYQ